MRPRGSKTYNRNCILAVYRMVECVKEIVKAALELAGRPMLPRLRPFQTVKEGVGAVYVLFGYIQHPLNVAGVGASYNGVGLVLLNGLHEFSHKPPLTGMGHLRGPKGSKGVNDRVWAAQPV